MGYIILILAIVGLGYACIQAYKAWGIAGGIVVVIIGIGLIVFLKFFGHIVALVFSVVVISFGRRVVMQRIVDEVIPSPVRYPQPPPQPYLAPPAPQAYLVHPAPQAYLAPPPPPPGAVACPTCHSVQAQDSRFCKSCGRPLAQPCPQCQALVGPDARFCPKCGRSTAPTCPKCNKPIDPSSRFCKHCGAPTAAQDASPAAPSTQAKRKEVFVGAMQFVQDPNEEGFAFCSECGKKEEKRNLYHNDEINQYVHRDCLMSLQENPEAPK